MTTKPEELTIHDYATKGDLDGIQRELARGVDINARQAKTHLTPLMSAVISGRADLNIVRYLLAQGAEVNAIAIEPSKFAALAESRTTALSLAAKGNIEIVRDLLDAGADVNFRDANGYDVLIRASSGKFSDPNVLPMLKLLIERGAPLNGISSYSESALSITSNAGRFDAVRLLLSAGADPAPLQWTPLMHAIALGSIDDVTQLLASGADLSARDFWSRTPWLLSIASGDVANARILLAAGSDRSDRGRCGKVPLAYSSETGQMDMLRFLLSEGFAVDDTDEFGHTALLTAVEYDNVEAARILIEAGAALKTRDDESLMKLAESLDMVRLLQSHRCDLNDISKEMRQELTNLREGDELSVTLEDFLAGRRRRFGSHNPEKIDEPFWNAMVRARVGAYGPRVHFHDNDHREPIWCFDRFGQSINELPDGRIIEIAGEHEDGYDPDFCIYNDVVVHHVDGTFDIFVYPEAVFPPTDFHTATLVDNTIYIIGCLGYPAQRVAGQTPIYRLDTHTLAIEAFPTSGDNPGWIFRHHAHYADGNILVIGGEIQTADKTFVPNLFVFSLDPRSGFWSRSSLSQ